MTAEYLKLRIQELIREIKEKNPEIVEIYINLDEVVAFYETEYIMKIYTRNLEIIVNKVEKKINIYPLYIPGE
jgi:hypothetical protein